MAIKTRSHWAEYFRVDQATFDTTVESVRYRRRDDGLYIVGPALKLLRFRLGKLRRGERIEPYKPLAPTTR
jgi:hypothetical protein